MKPLCANFIATVYFANETARYVTWMTKTEKLTMTWDEVGGLLGYEEHGPSCALPDNFDDEWIRIHYTVKSKPKDALEPLYYWKTYICGASKGLHPTYDILHRDRKSVV